MLGKRKRGNEKGEKSCIGGVLLLFSRHSAFTRALAAPLVHVYPIFALVIPS
jgi:hypothetical protein